MKKTTDTTHTKRFISILSDYGFKVTFGNESDTRFLRKAIQLLIKSTVPIKEVTFEKNDVAALTKSSRSGIFDLTCKDEKGKVYIVEMQLNDFKHFIHRGKFYAFHRLNKMIQKGKYRFNDLKPIYIISFLAGNTFKTKEFHQIGTLRNQHDELIDNQITHIFVELDKWRKTENELKTDLDKLLYIMKFTETATINEEIPKSLGTAEWIEAMIKELDKRNMTQEQLIALEMSLAREGSMLAVEEAKIEEARKEERKKAKKRLDFERKKTEKKVQKIAEEKKLAEQKLIEEKELAAQKLAEEKKLAAQKLAESAKQLFLLKTLSDQQIATILDLPIKKVQQLKKDFKHPNN